LLVNLQTKVDEFEKKKLVEGFLIII
jgi:hypothetical protein